MRERDEHGAIVGEYDLFKVIDGEWAYMATVKAQSQRAAITTITEPGRWCVFQSYGVENIVIPKDVPTTGGQS